LVRSAITDRRRDCAVVAAIGVERDLGERLTQRPILGLYARIEGVDAARQAQTVRSGAALDTALQELAVCHRSAAPDRTDEKRPLALESCAPLVLA
jgi:hypothetical protein